MKTFSTVQAVAKRAALVAILIGMFMGCASRTRVVVHPARAKVVVIKKGHIHNNRCGHYKYRGSWYYVNGHHHGARCGHAMVKGVWIIR
jgi:hypothetical protein